MKRIDLANSSHLKLLVYGRPGAGKTTFCGSAAADQRSAPVLLVNCGGNPQSLRKQADKPFMVGIDTLNDLNDIYDFFAADQPATHRLAELAQGARYKTLIFDGITTIQQLVIDLQAGGASKLNQTPRQLEIQQWGGVLRHMLNISAHFLERLNGLHIIVTALEDVPQYDTGGVMQQPYQAALSGRSQVLVPGAALGYYRIATKEAAPRDLRDRVKHNVLITQPLRDTAAKDQHLLASPFIADPTVTKLLDLLT